jgi:hypothetical protein
MDIRERGLQPDTITYNAFMKVQISAGKDEIIRAFETFNQLITAVEPDMATYVTLLRACTILESVELAEEIYLTALNWAKENEGRQATHRSTANNHVGIGLYNTMLDAYSESRSPMAFSFFDQLISKKLPVDGVTFNTYAKACIFMDQRIRLVQLPELMRVEGIMQKELSAPVRLEIKRAFEIHALPDALKQKNIDSQYYLESKKGINDTQHGDFFEDLMNVQPWGRRIDERDYIFMKLLDDTTLKKFRIDIDKWQNSYTPFSLTEANTMANGPDSKPYHLHEARKEE